MFSLINLILTIFILVRVYRFDKFYLLTYDMRLHEDENKKREKFKRRND